MSVRSARTRLWGEPVGGDATVLVDLPSPTLFSALRNVDPVVLRQRGATWLVRADLSEDDREKQLADIRALCERWQLDNAVALLEQPVGGELSLTAIHNDPPPAERWPDLLAQARAAELRALLEWGNAIWRPTAYHYRLPSGEHARDYVHVAHAIREPRDAYVLATWLYPHVRDGTGFVLDCGALTPVAQAAVRAIEGAGLRANPVAVLDRYPATAVDLHAAVDLAAGDDGHVLGLVSSVAGRDGFDQLGSALRQAVGIRTRRLEVLVGASGMTTREDVEVWTPMPGGTAIVEDSVADERCALCNSSDRARVIPVNPDSLDGMLPAQLRQIVPLPSQALTNSRFWTFADEADAVGVQARSHTGVSAHRSDELPMGVVVRVEELIGREDFQQACAGWVGDLQRSERLGRDFDLVLAPEHERSFDGYEDFWASIREIVAPQVALPDAYPLADAFSDELERKIAEAERILVLCVGVVTGMSLQRGLVGVQDVRARTGGGSRQLDYDIDALALHARPATLREWQTLRNSYGRDRDTGRHALRYGWRSVIPEPSPFEDELNLLDAVDPAELDDSVKGFYQERRRICNGSAGNERLPLFWGSRDDDRVTKGAIFGDRLSPRAAYVAVGAAMEAARTEHEEKASPEFRVFELAAMVRSYYDPLILASFFRWLRPHEAWWGWQPAEGEATIGYMLSRASEDHKRILVPELLLAAAQGKLTAPVVRTVFAAADELRVGSDDARVIAALELGRVLASSAEAAPAPSPAAITPPSAGSPG